MNVREIVNKIETKLTARQQSPRRWRLAIRVPSCTTSCRSSCCRTSRTTPSWTATRTRRARPTSRTRECSWRQCSWERLFPSSLICFLNKNNFTFFKNELIVRHMFCHWRQNKIKVLCAFERARHTTELNEGTDNKKTKNINSDFSSTLLMSLLLLIYWIRISLNGQCRTDEQTNGEREIFGIPAELPVQRRSHQNGRNTKVWFVHQQNKEIINLFSLHFLTKSFF